MPSWGVQSILTIFGYRDVDRATIDSYLNHSHLSPLFSRSVSQSVDKRFSELNYDMCMNVRDVTADIILIV